MGAVSDPEDLANNRRKIIQNALKDLSPETKKRVVKIFETWKGRASERELEEILGGQKAKKFRELVDNSTDEVSSNEIDNLRKLFRESVTFD
ncbi:MAG: hypothetical protein WBX01_03060 [Nitrososphaeraceae archaeon]